MCQLCGQLSYNGSRWLRVGMAIVASSIAPATVLFLWFAGQRLVAGVVLIMGLLVGVVVSRLTDPYVMRPVTPAQRDVSRALTYVSLGVVLALVVSAFAFRKTAVVGEGTDPARYRDGASAVQTDPLKSSEGRRVSLAGVAEPRKVGAALRGDGFYVWIDGLQHWPADYVNQRVGVVGVLEVRHDLPVFAADTPEERMQVQGMPVPSGTDLHEASRRYVVRDARWSLLR